MPKSSKKSSDGNKDASNDNNAKKTKNDDNAAASNNVNNNNIISLEEQLDKALVAVTTNYEQTMKLHEAWRQQLSRISLLVLFIILNQVKEPGSVCMKSVQDWNTNKMASSYNNSEDVIITKSQAFLLLAKDSMMEGMSLFCSLCVVWWITTLPVEVLRQNNEFKALPFQVASALLPLIIAVYAQQPVMGCLRHLEDPYPTTASDDDEETFQKRTFPVVLIFYAVTALSMFAMKAQRNSGEEQIHKVQKLRKDLLEMKKTK